MSTRTDIIKLYKSMLENRSYSLILLFHERLEDYGVRINYQSVYHGLMQDGRFEDLLLNYDLLQAKGVSVDYELVLGGMCRNCDPESIDRFSDVFAAHHVAVSV